MFKERMCIYVATLLAFILMVENYFIFCSENIIHWSTTHYRPKQTLYELEKLNTKPPSIRDVYSQWFAHNMSNVSNPFWTKNNIRIDSDSYKWWMAIQHRKPDNLNDALGELFKMGINSNRTRLSEEETGFIKCALVGSSDNLLEANHGEIIDSHNYIIRFNQAITKGFEKHVGSKTTHQLMYPESAFADLNKNISFVLVPFKPNDLRWLAHALENRPYKSEWYAKPPSKLECNIPKISIIHPSFIRFTHKFLDQRIPSKRTKYPSTGFIGLILALHQCDKVNVFGYGANSRGQWLHYYGPRTYSGQHFFHDDEGEKRAMKKMEEEGIISIFGPGKSERI